jgi:ferrous iron transport protein A
MIFRFGSRTLSSESRPLPRAAKHVGQRRSTPGSPKSSPSRLSGVSACLADLTDPSRKMQLLPLCDLAQGAHAIIHEIHLAASAADQIMLFGFMSGVEVVACQCGPGGDPRVYRLDGAEVAVRRATARHILVRLPFAQEQV